HVMFAMALERNVLQQHDLVITAHFLEHAAQMPRRVLAIADAIFLPRPRHALGRVAQPLPLRVVAGPADQGADRVLHIIGNRNLAIRFLVFAQSQAVHQRWCFLSNLVIARANNPPRRKRPRLPPTNSNISAGSSGSSTARSASPPSNSPTSSGS